MRTNNLDTEWKRNFVSDQLEARACEEMGEVSLRARIEIIDAKDLVSLVEQALA